MRARLKVVQSGFFVTKGLDITIQDHYDARRPFREVNGKMPLDANRTRIARDLLGWSQQTLANRAGVQLGAVVTLERTGLATTETEARIRLALEGAGIDLRKTPGDPGPGVRFRPQFRLTG